jgi:hypothetical protein
MATKSDIASCLEIIRRLEAELDAATKLPRSGSSAGSSGVRVKICGG